MRYETENYIPQAMRLGLFSQGDSVLLLGEGNFSFAKSLLAHNLPIKITATCLDVGTKYKNQLANIDFLMKNEIPVLLDVDATKLHEHPILRSQIYSKIIFNFPHVGGKMKIQLNRELVKKVCESSSCLLENGGLLLISLCNGQGGTPADNPQRKWDDSWQVTEMAAYGSFCLISVEPFDFDNFELYDCTGYRSQDSHFNLKGALVHVFKKKITPPRLINDKSVMERLSHVSLFANSDILVPFYYSELYVKSPLNNSKSSVCFFKNLLLTNLGNKLKLVSDELISVAVDSSNGVICKSNGKHLRLRSSAVQIIDKIVEVSGDCCREGKFIFFPGMFFNSCLSNDFEKTPPISIQFVLLGENVSIHVKNFLIDLVSTFKTDKTEFRTRKIFSTFCKAGEINASGSDEIVKCINKSISNCVSAVEWRCIDKNAVEIVVAHKLHLDNSNVKLEAIVIYLDKLSEIFFRVKNWKESWSEDSFVSFDLENVPILNQGLLYPMPHQFDITLRYETDVGLANDDVYETLRLSAIDMIKEVELINEYNSGIGWSSKCFRITYQSLSESLNRSKALDVHTNFISKMLISALSVVIK